MVGRVKVWLGSKFVKVTETGKWEGEERVGLVKVPGGGEGRLGGGGGGGNGCGCECCCMRLMACPTGPYPLVRGYVVGCAGIIAAL